MLSWKAIVDLTKKNVAYALLKVFCITLQSFTKKKVHQTVPAGIYLLKVNNRNTRTRCEICSKLTIKTPERRLASFWCLYC